VLHCANGWQKENQEAVNRIEDYPQKGSEEDGETSQEIINQEICPEEG